MRYILFYSMFSILLLAVAGCQPDASGESGERYPQMVQVDSSTTSRDCTCPLQEIEHQIYSLTEVRDRSGGIKGHVEGEAELPEILKKITDLNIRVEGEAKYADSLSRVSKQETAYSQGFMERHKELHECICYRYKLKCRRLSSPADDSLFYAEAEALYLLCSTKKPIVEEGNSDSKKKGGKERTNELRGNPPAPLVNPSLPTQSSKEEEVAEETAPTCKISGMITDGDSGLSEVKIFIGSEEHSLGETDQYGRFTVTIPNDRPIRDLIPLVFSKAGYSSKIVNFGMCDDTGSQKVNLSKSN